MNWSIIVISLADIRQIYRLDMATVSYNYNLSIESCDIAYDWMIREAFKRTTGCNVTDHYRHDIYICIYEDYGREIESYIRNKFRVHNLRFSRSERLKLLIAGDTLIVAKGINDVL